MIHSDSRPEAAPFESSWRLRHPFRTKIRPLPHSCGARRGEICWSAFDTLRIRMHRQFELTSRVSICLCNYLFTIDTSAAIMLVFLALLATSSVPKMHFAPNRTRTRFILDAFATSPPISATPRLRRFGPSFVFNHLRTIASVTRLTAHVYENTRVWGAKPVFCYPSRRIFRRVQYSDRLGSSLPGRIEIPGTHVRREQSCCGQALSDGEEWWAAF